MWKSARNVVAELLRAAEAPPRRDAMLHLAFASPYNPPVTYTTAYIALGANLGDRAANLRGALERLSATPGVSVTHTSSFLENPAVGGPPGSPAFLNAVAAVSTSLEPEDLLRRLLQIELAMGRVRQQKNDARPIDLDIVLFGDRVICTPELTVPHPLMHLRDFVLVPLAEIAPRLKHPVFGRDVATLLAEQREAAAPPPSPDAAGASIVNTDLRCDQCGYNLRHLPRRHACPECGLAYDVPDEADEIDVELEALAEKTGYPTDAFLLVLDSVATLAEEWEEVAPIDLKARDLCRGVRKTALAVCEDDAKARWLLGGCNIRASEDVGKIVFALVEAGRLNACEGDAPSDFHGLFTLETLFPTAGRTPAASGVGRVDE